MAKVSSRDLVCVAVAHALRDERKRQGLSMERLAEKAGLSTSMVSLFERDLRNPTLDTLLRLADVLKVDLGKLIQEASAKVKKQVGAKIK